MESTYTKAPDQVDAGSSASGGKESTAGEGEQPSPAAAFAEAAERLVEAKDYLAYYIGTRLDQTRLALRRVVIFVALWIVAMLAASALAVVAIVLVCLGVAQAIARLTGHVWVGDLVTGLLMLGAMGGVGYVGINKAMPVITRETFVQYQRNRRRKRNAVEGNKP